MSLKAFHLVFIVVAAALCAVFAWWSIAKHLGGVDGPYLVLGLFSATGAFGLLVYGRAFLAKMKDVSYL